MTSWRTVLQCSVVVVACGGSLVSCLEAEGLDESAEQGLGRASQALVVGTDTLQNEDESAQATCTVATFAEDIANDIAEIECNISDRAADGHSVYVDWSQDGFGAVRLSNEQGAGSTLFAVDARQNFSAGFSELRWKVCTDVQLFGDDCSDTVFYEL